MMNSVELSIVILSYNSKKFTLESIGSIEENYGKELESGSFEIIVADNDSTDGSLAAFEEHKKKSRIRNFRIIDNAANIGFSAGNNRAVKYAEGKYVLFLNPDTLVNKDTLNYLLEFADEHADAGALTCRLVNKDGEMDFNCHRGFPTAWNSFCYFVGLQRIFPKSKIFAGYTMGWKDASDIHEVEAVEGAFMLVPKAVGERVGWWDEDYFFYGEDLQFCFDIKKLGYKIYYVGVVTCVHVGGASSGIKKKTENLSGASVDVRRKLQAARFEAMRIFFRKNYSTKYPQFVRSLIFAGISLLHKRAVARLDKTVR